ncbi:cell wall hydrolase [uncultured Sphingomonas sp.]|uniref:cell wall hydrolase n=1 Tax=uncultured Sphingomonas sp. TaxID=158754 RepID=UPI0035CC6370
MRERAGLAKRGAMGLLLLLVTSCLAPEPPRAVKAARPVTDTRELVRQLAPGVSERALAALPDRALAPVPQAAAPDAPPPFLAQAATEADAARARDCLTAAVYYEARSEPVDGQRAVAQVVLNRVRDRAFPHSVCGVVYQGVGAGRACQFSFACDGSMLRPRQPSAWALAERVATMALDGDVMAAVGNATFYHANYVLPWWASSLVRLGAIGNHIFYRWPGAVERALGLRADYAGIEPSGPALGGASDPVQSAATFGVTVHRGGDTAVAQEAAAPAAAAAGPTAPGGTPTPIIKAAHITVSGGLFTAAGVRVHRGEDSPVIASDASGES